LGEEKSVVFSTTTPALSAAQYARACSGLAPQYRGTCYIYLASFIRHDMERSGTSDIAAQLAQETAACDALTAPERSYCFRGIGTDGGTTFGDFSRFPAVKKQCAALHGDDRLSCTEGVATIFSLYAHYPEAVAYCDSFADASLGKSCYNAVFGTA